MARRQDTESATGAPPSADGAFDFAQVLAIADALPMGLAFVDRGLRYRFVNTALCEFFDRPRSEVLGHRMDDMLGAEAMEARRPMVEQALAGERLFFTADYPHPQRGHLTIQSNYLPQRDESGAVNGLVILVNDVTEQRVAERALMESEARFRRIADSAPVLIWVTRLDRTRDFVNDAYKEFIGLGREEAQSFDWRQAIHPDDVDRIVAESVAGEASAKRFTLEGRYRRHDGEWRWLKSVSQPRFGPDGDLIGFIGTATDITQSKEAEQDLQRKVEERTAELSASDQRFRAIFDTVSTVLVLLDPDGTIIDTNRTPAPWRRVRSRNGVGEKLWEGPTLGAYPELGPFVRDLIARAAAGETVETAMTLEARDQPRADLSVSVQPIRDRDGGIQYLLFEARDETELKAAQDQLRQAQKMEALGQLTGGIAHDFNNLLTVVVGGLDLISRQIDDERLKRYATNALTAAERGARLTAQLLAFSRVQRLEVKPVQVGPLIEGMRPLLRNVLGGKIEKAFDLDTDCITVMADPTQLELVVLNLAINARDAMPEGGRLTIVTRPVSIANDRELDDGDYVELCVSDTGTGMAEDVVARAFEPFFTTKEVGKGTGLGLSMVYGVAKQSGGTARIESEPGQGTTVRLYFRHASQPADQEETGSDTRVETLPDRDRTVLVIDDDPDVRDFVTSSLTDFGYRVDQADDGPTGLERFATSRPDVVILDYAMPGMTGGEVAAAILGNHPEQPLLFISGYSESEAIRRSAPDATLLSKPFKPEALDRAVRAALGRGKNRASER